MSKKCIYLDVLEAFLSKFDHQKEVGLPNGQQKYTFRDGLVVNVYTTTGSVVFQGQETQGQLSQLIDKQIDLINLAFAK